MKTISTINGLSTRYDIPTKCTVVNIIMLQQFSSKEAANDKIKELADELMVSPVTIKIWIQKYHNIRQIGMSLPEGTMAYSPVVITEKKLPKVKAELNKIKSQINQLKFKFETTKLKGKASDYKSTKTSSELLDELIKG